jgi:pSer/pThr/pTyr-binding forkhead associated (FHA) protein
VELVDQGSGCGTFVNGQRTSRHALRVNHVVFIGDVTLRFSAR